MHMSPTLARQQMRATAWNAALTPHPWSYPSHQGRGSIASKHRAQHARSATALIGKAQLHPSPNDVSWLREDRSSDRCNGAGCKIDCHTGPALL